MIPEDHITNNKRTSVVSRSKWQEIVFKSVSNKPVEHLNSNFNMLGGLITLPAESRSFLSVSDSIIFYSRLWTHINAVFTLDNGEGI